MHSARASCRNETLKLFTVQVKVLARTFLSLRTPMLISVHAIAHVALQGPLQWEKSKDYYGCG